MIPDNITVPLQIVPSKQTVHNVSVS